MIDQVFVDTSGDTLRVGVSGAEVSFFTHYPNIEDACGVILYFEPHQIDAIIAALQMARDAAGG